MKLSEALVLDARLSARVSERSIAGQVEFWARLGRALEPLLCGDKVLALKRRGDSISLSELLATVDDDQGRVRVTQYLEAQVFPHYEAVPDEPGLLIRVEEDGRRTVGRFVRRQFVPSDQAAGSRTRERSPRNPSSPKKRSPR